MVEISGNEKELRKLLREHKHKQKPLVSKKTRKFFYEHRYFIMGMLTILIATAIVMFGVQSMMDSKYMTGYECNQLITKALVDSHQSFWMQFWFTMKGFIPILVLAITVGWIFHGVGFRII